MNSQPGFADITNGWRENNQEINTRRYTYVYRIYIVYNHIYRYTNLSLTLSLSVSFSLFICLSLNAIITEPDPSKLIALPKIFLRSKSSVRNNLCAHALFYPNDKSLFYKIIMTMSLQSCCMTAHAPQTPVPWPPR